MPSKKKQAPTSDPRSALPAVHELLAAAQAHPTLGRLDPSLCKRLLREALASLRRKPGATDVSTEAILALASANLSSHFTLRKVINGTGVLLHTNLGRAPIPEGALARLSEIRGYTTLELEPAGGKRSQRHLHVERLVQLLFGAESGCLVNNNAAALFLILSALAAGKEVIISRGEQIEIGGKFRIPDILEASGALLREVGTTNKTRVADYERAIGRRTALVLKVHKSNFRQEGFVEEPALASLAALCRRKRVPLVYDLGSGALHDLAPLGLPEPLLDETVVSQCGLVCLSTDKLIGSVQGGLVLGRKRWVEKLVSHPLYRVLRPDKLSLFLVLETLRLHRSSTPEQVPLRQMLSVSPRTLKRRAQALGRLAKKLAPRLDVQAVPSRAYAGGGSSPGQAIPSWALRLRDPNRGPQALHQAFLRHEPPILGYVRDEAFFVDVRTLLSEDDRLLRRALPRLLQPLEECPPSNDRLPGG